MTINSTTRKTSNLVGNGNTATYPFAFKVFTDADVVVKKLEVSTSIETTLTLGANNDYIVTLNEDQNGNPGGSITLKSGGNNQNLPNGFQLVITSALEPLQGTDLTNQGGFYPEVINDALDKAVILHQQQQDEIDRSIKFSLTNTIGSLEITENANARKNRVLGFDNLGEFEVLKELGTYRGNWAASTAYAVRDLVKDTSTGNIFFCNTAHTSSGSQPLTTNTHSANWDLIVDAATATTSATNAASSATAAANSATAAANSATAAATSETNAGNSATTATTKASQADTAKTAAETAKTAAETAKTAAEAALDSFDDRYLGAKANNPTLDNDGNALIDGALYFNTTSNIMRVYDLGNTTWLDLNITGTNLTNVNTVAGAITNVNNVGGSIANVNTVASNISNVNTVAADIAKVVVVANDLNETVSEIETAAADLQETTSEIDTVANAIGNVDNVGNNIANVNTVAGISTEVSAVANNAANVNTVGSNIANVNNVGGSIANVNTVATGLSGVNAFAARYRVGSSNPNTDLDAGDLFFNTTLQKLLVYNGTTSAWEETQTIGNFFINTLSAFNGTGGNNSGAFDGVAYKFTLSNAGQFAQQMLVSIAGVVQKPNSGTGQPSEGFALDGANIVFSSPPPSGADYFIITIGASVSIGTPSDNTVTSAKIVDGSIVNADVNANAAIAKSKLAALDIVNADINASAAIAKSKLAALDIVNADVNASANIAGSKIADDSISLAKLEHGDSNNDGKFLRANNGADPTFETVNTDLVSDSSPQLGGLLDGNGNTANFTGNNTGLGLPIGTNSNAPTASNYKGYIRYNDDDDVVYYSDGSSWKKLSSVSAVLSSVTGDIFAGAASTLTLAGTGFLSANLVVNFNQTSDNINVNVTVTPSSDTAATVTVPSSVYNNVTSSNVVTIKVTNSDGSQSSGVNKTALGLPTGGTITTSGNYRIHTFTSSGNLVMTIARAVEYLVIGGGGGVGGRRHSGGGGAGGYRTNVSGETSGGGGSAESAMNLTAQTYAVTVGGGGSSGPNNANSNSQASAGGNSSFNGITANGGGYGGTYNTAGQSGGSGGGSGSTASGYSNGGSGTANQGTQGGIGGPNMSAGAGGGGGGASAAGGNATANGNNADVGGAGGNGVSSSITGSAVTRGGGGGGGSDTYGADSTPGSGGGGTGVNGSKNPTSGAANTGGGAGGGGQDGRVNPNGGSGVVIVRYQV